jgi:uncharacterized protein with FMN-binding domain
MRRVGIWFAGTVVVMVRLFLYRTSTSGPQAGTTTVATGPQAPGVIGSSGGPTPAGSSSPGSSKSNGGSAGRASTTTTKVNGSVAQTRWGPVQVQVTISSGKIVDVTALVYPSGNGRDYEINSYALPQLRQQALAAQSAHIDGVSGATVTSGGYRESLQAALDAAHFGS